MNCEHTKIDFKLPVHAVATRWNSLTMAIERALEFCPALEKLFMMSKWDKAGKDGLRCYCLSNDEWEILGQLDVVLKVRQLVNLQMTYAH